MTHDPPPESSGGSDLLAYLLSASADDSRSLSQRNPLKSLFTGSAGESHEPSASGIVHFAAVAKVDELLSQAVREERAHRVSDQIEKARPFRGLARRIREAANGHRPGWPVWLATLLIPIVIPLSNLFGQSPPPPRPVPPIAIVQRSSDPYSPDPRFPERGTSEPYYPEWASSSLRALRGQVHKLSLQGRVALALGYGQQGTAMPWLEGLTIHQRFRLAVDGLSRQEIREVRRKIVTEATQLLADSSGNSSAS